MTLSRRLALRGLGAVAAARSCRAISLPPATRPARFQLVVPFCLPAAIADIVARLVADRSARD